MTTAGYLLLAVYLIATLGIGGMFYRRGSSSAEFLFADKPVSWIPVAISILATGFSAITLPGMPAFIYQRGMQSAPVVYMLPLLVIPLVRRYVAPFCHKLNISTPYELLERRFDLRVRTAASFIFLMMRGIYMGIVIYAPSLDRARFWPSARRGWTTDGPASGPLLRPSARRKCPTSPSLCAGRFPSGR
jgi:Na+/proline symporter